eukprot:SAG22_NODE_2093_length_3020_cov_8.343033_2_plen_77_part_00
MPGLHVCRVHVYVLRTLNLVHPARKKPSASGCQWTLASDSESERLPAPRLHVCRTKTDVVDDTMQLMPATMCFVFN